MTPAETNAIRALERLARNWPSTLWLFAGDGTLCVMRHDDEGRKAVIGDDSSAAMDPDYVLASIDIPCDGGGW